LAGGQGTRLGSKDPKGLLDINLASKKSLFQYFSEKLIRLDHVARHKFPEKAKNFEDLIPFYVMTSFATDSRTK